MTRRLTTPRFLAVLAVLCLTLIGLARGAQGSAGAGARRVVQVAAAADLRIALEAIAARFEAGEPNVTVSVSYGSTGMLAQQARQGAPFDLLLAADDSYTAALDRDGLVTPGYRRVYALGRLALWLPDRLGLDPSALGLKALLDPKVARVAMANPLHAPYGLAAQGALSKAGLLEALKPKLVYGENVSQAAQLALTAADAGLVARSLLGGMPGGRSWVLPTDLAAPLRQEAVVLRGHDRPEVKAFYRFLFTSGARDLLTKNGFGLR